MQQNFYSGSKYSKKHVFFQKRDYDMTKNISFFALVVESENKGKLLMRNLRYQMIFHLDILAADEPSIGMSANLKYL